MVSSISAKKALNTSHAAPGMVKFPQAGQIRILSILPSSALFKMASLQVVLMYTQRFAVFWKTPLRSGMPGALSFLTNEINDKHTMTRDLK